MSLAPAGANPTIKWDPATNRIYKETDANSRVTVHIYDPYANRSKLTYPLLENQTAGNEANESWTFNADGRLLSYVDRRKVETKYAYGGPGDPLNVGMPTTETCGGLDWTHVYYRSGKRKSTREPFYGGTTDFAYDVLDRIGTIKMPEFQAITGTDETTAAAAREQRIFHYDENGNQAGDSTFRG
jgi:hypothetical protein